MLRKRSMKIIPVAALVLVLIFAGQSAQADWSISFSGESRSSYDSHQLGDRITSEYRRAYQMDDWIERGGSSVTDSPIFSDGVRLAAWSTQYGDDYDYALASAIYFFELPSRARSVKIKISYNGEADRNAFNDDIAGRVWIKRAHIGDDYEEYYPSEGRYEDVDKPLYGDTFVLRSRKNYEIIRLSADDYSIDGMMELHVVAEGRQRIDVKYIEVETYTSSSSYRVITRYSRDYEWQPWYNYTYWYFYTGPVYNFGDYYYVRYTYPRYRHHYVDIRRRYNSYLRVYYIKRPEHRVHWSHVNRVPRGTRRTWDRSRLSRWTPDHEETRKRYAITSTKRRRPVEIQQSRTRIRSVLSSHRRSSPAATRARSRVNVDTSRTRTESRISSSTRTRGSTSRSASPSRSPARVETQNRTGSQRDVRSSTRTRSSSSSQSSSKSNVRQAPTRSANSRSSVKRSPTRNSTQETERSKIQRESTKSRSSTQSKSSSSVKKSPSRGTTQKKSPPKKVETKKDDDDDDDEDEKKKSSSRSSSSQSSSRKTRRSRTR